MQNGIPPTTVRVPPDLRSEIDRAAKENNRTFSGELLYRARIGLAVQQHWTAHGAVTGALRLADLERLANSNVGVPMADHDTDPRPTDVGSQGNVGAPAFGGPFGKSTVDEKVLAQNSGRQTPISKAAHDANKQHLADHLARVGGKPWSK